MPNYNRRFTKDEFKQELTKHLEDVPPGFLRARDKLEKHAEAKAGHYERALNALDDAAAKLKAIAESHPDDSARQEADTALKKIDEAINAYGEAAMDFNSIWQEDSK